MGWAYYVIDGRPCGYAVQALCDSEYCFERIDRGMGWLCGEMPGGDDHGCGGYFCSQHLYDHGCDAMPDDDEHYHQELAAPGGSLYGKAYADAEQRAREDGAPWPPEQPRRCPTCRHPMRWENTPQRWVHAVDYRAGFPPCALDGEP